MTSAVPLAGRCGAECRDGNYCENYPVTGSTRCRMHGAGGGAPAGEANGSYDHGAFSEAFFDDLSAPVDEVVAELQHLLEEPTGAQEVARGLAAACLIQWDRSTDPRFLRRFEGLCTTFGIAPSASQQERLRGDLKATLDEPVDDIPEGTIVPMAYSWLTATKEAE